MTPSVVYRTLKGLHTLLEQIYRKVQIQKQHQYVRKVNLGRLKGAFSLAKWYPGRGVKTVHRYLSDGKTKEKEGLFCLVIIRSSGKKYRKGHF